MNGSLTRYVQTFLHEMKPNQVWADIFTWPETWPGISRHIYINWNLTRYWQTFLHELEPDQVLADILHELKLDQVLADIFSWTKTCLGKGRHSTWQGIDRHFYMNWNLTKYWQTFLRELKPDQAGADIFTRIETGPGVGRHFYMNWNLTRYWQTFLHELTCPGIGRHFYMNWNLTRY